LSQLNLPLVALEYDLNYNRIIALQLVNAGSGFWQFHILTVDTSNGNVEDKLSLPKDDTYVNFQWTTFDSKTGYLYLLAGITL
jgi:hypothetical protein